MTQNSIASTSCGRAQRVHRCRSMIGALDELLHELEAMEWAALHPTLHRLRHEQQALATDVSQLYTHSLFNGLEA